MKAGLNMPKKDQEVIEGWVRNPIYTAGYRKGFIAGQEARCDNCILMKIIAGYFRINKLTGGKK
jgi:hypothetical protein